MNRQRIVLCICAVLAICIWASVLFSSSKTLDVTFMDVGEGLCAVIRTPSGKTIVFDCGTSTWRDDESVGDKLVAPYLQSMGVNNIDVAVLSHPHADHTSGYSRLLQQIPAKTVLDIGVKDKSPYYKNFLNTIKSSGSHYRIAEKGQVIDMNDGVVLQVLNPDPIRQYSDLNNKSIVLRLTYKKTSFLFMADTECETEDYMLSDNSSISAQILQIGHHGSAKSTSPVFLEAVQPQAAVISCGRNNDYGHPSDKLIDRLAGAGVRIYRTDKNGAISFSTDGESIKVHTFRKFR